MRNRFVGADHGDIIGHYPRSNGAQAYDLLHSLPTFSGRAIAAVGEASPRSRSAGPRSRSVPPGRPDPAPLGK